MKKLLIVLPPMILLFFVLCSYKFYSNTGKPPVYSSDKGFAVVELFTSEGCSSCPPADEAMAALAKEYPANVYVLEFHVDYWDKLGWKDAFSSADYTARQQQYAAVFNINSIYTPQAIVNGQVEFTGSDRKKLSSAIKDALNKNVNSGIDINARANGSKEITVSWSAKTSGKAVLQLALVQLAASSNVQRGENKGLLLHHVNIVRDFKTVSQSSGTIKMHLPGALAAKDCSLIAFVQNKPDWRISGVGMCGIQ